MRRTDLISQMIDLLPKFAAKLVGTQLQYGNTWKGGFYQYARDFHISWADYTRACVCVRWGGGGGGGRVGGG